MTRRILGWLSLSSFAFSTLALAGQPERAAKLELNDDGLQVVAEELEHLALGDIRNAVLDDWTGRVDYGIDAALRGIHYSLKFDNLRIDTVGNRLRARVGIHDVHVNISRIVLSKDLWVGSIGTTCYGIYFSLGEGEALPLTGRLQPDVVSGVTDVGVSDVDFSISESDYQVYGPSYCTGILGTGYIFRYVVGRVLKNSRERIESMVENRIKDMGPYMAQILDQQSRLEIDWVVDVPPLPLTPMTLRTWPSGFHIADGKLHFTLGATVAEGRSKGTRSPVRPLGKLGLNPDLINEALVAIVAEGVDPIPLDRSLAPQLEELLQPSSAAAIWPDLFAIELGEGPLHMTMGITTAPQFDLDEENQFVKLHMPDLELGVTAPIAGEQVDYFRFDADLRMNLEMVEDEGGGFRLKLAESPELALEGFWADTYEPVIDHYEHDLAETLLESGLEVLYSKNSLWRGELPRPPLETTPVGLYNPHVEEPYLMVDLRTAAD